MKRELFNEGIVIFITTSMCLLRAARTSDSFFNSANFKSVCASISALLLPPIPLFLSFVLERSMWSFKRNN